MPHHQIHGSIGQRLRLRNKTLNNNSIKKKKLNTKTTPFRNERRIEKKKSCTDMGMVLPPRLALLGEASTSDTTRHYATTLSTPSESTQCFRPSSISASFSFAPSLRSAALCCGCECERAKQTRLFVLPRLCFHRNVRS